MRSPHARRRAYGPHRAQVRLSKSPTSHINTFLSACDGYAVAVGTYVLVRPDGYVGGISESAIAVRIARKGIESSTIDGGDLVPDPIRRKATHYLGFLTLAAVLACDKKLARIGSIPA
jgi:hypothetical protein